MRKEETIDIRVSARAKALLVAAANVRHTLTSEFILGSALREAENALADKRVFQVSEENWSAFMDILNAPASPDPSIVSLARSRAPWDR